MIVALDVVSRCAKFEKPLRIAVNSPEVSTRVMVLTGCFRMMKATAVIILMMGVSALSSPYGLALPSCEEDHECSENMFCYEMRNCVECCNCASYYRKPNAKKICARAPIECGECIDGYKADILTSGVERDYCRVEEKTTVPTAGSASPMNYTTIPVGCAIVAIVVAVAVYIVHKWRKIRYRDGEQPVQNLQQSHHTGSGNGMSPLLGNVNERKPSLGERAPCDRLSAPPQPSAPPQLSPSPQPPPPPYESSVMPLRDEAAFVMEHMVKRQDAMCFREPNLQILSFPVEEPDDQSTDESDVDVTFHPDINIESGYPSAFHDDDTLPASAYGNDEAVEQSEMNSPPNAESPSFFGVFTNLGVNNSGGGESCDMNDSGLSQASSSVSVSSLSVDGDSKCGTPNTSENLHAGGCRSEHCPNKRSEWQREEEGTASDAAGADGASLRLAGPSGSSEAHQAGVSSASQSSSSASLGSNTAVPHGLSEGPIAKRQKFDSGNSSTAEDLQEDEESWRSQESPRINVQAVTFLNVHNVLNYNIQNNFNTS